MDDQAQSTTADRIALAATAIRRRSSSPAATALILGTGLGELAGDVKTSATIPYGDIPGFPRSTALAHHGRLLLGNLHDQPVIILQGRCHQYEGYSLEELTLPVRVLAALGVKTLIITNASGGLNPNFTVGDVMLIDDHINLMCLGGTWPRDSISSGRIPKPAIRLYDPQLKTIAEQAARGGDFPLRRGVYIGVSGPSYETRAEYREFRRIGGDCVGMSTVPEVLAATAAGLRVLGLSAITNVACPDAPKTVPATEVVEVATTVLPKIRHIVQALLTHHL